MRPSNSLRALIFGVAVGFSFAVLPSSCGTVKPPTRCSASNCDGCCDDTGSCFKGTSAEACGATGASCTVCAMGQACSKVDQNSEFGGRCTGTGAGGGTGGGTTDGGTGGGTTGGGSGGGGGGGAGTCSATNCPNGCCSTAGVCITNTTPSRCGAGGGACASCMMGNTCVAGACTPCAGCIDINTGACQAGTTSALCGKAGGLCQVCDQQAGQTCNAGTCFGGNVCNASTCAGCCNGNSCVLPASQMTMQCGQGAPGAACVGCFNGATCDLDAGSCVGGGGTGGGGGGFPGLDGGGLPGFCDPMDPTTCPGGCCDSLGGILATCVNIGDSCGSLDFTNFACIVASCTCKSMGQCKP